jgi:hypothetical protein
VILRSIVARLRDLVRGGRAPAVGDPGSPKRDHPRLTRALRRVELEIADLPHEVAYAFSPDGRQLFRAQGGPDRVGFTPEQRSSLPGAILIHNHPGGGSFSPWGDPLVPGSKGDIESAAIHQVARTIVVGRGREGLQWRYIMEPPPGGWSRELWEQRLGPAVERADREETDQLLAGLRSTGELPAADPDWAHRIWTSVAEETGVQYRRERR